MIVPEEYLANSKVVGFICGSIPRIFQRLCKVAEFESYEEGL